MIHADEYEEMEQCELKEGGKRERERNRGGRGKGEGKGEDEGVERGDGRGDREGKEESGGGGERREGDRGGGGDVWKDTGSMRKPPFTVYPVLFFLKKGEFMDLNIEFVPLCVGDHICVFYLLCNNGQNRRFTVTASSREVSVSVVEINNTQYNEKITDLASDLYFSPVTVLTEKTQQIVLVNDTGVPIEYEWVWVPCTVQRTDALEMAREIVRWGRYFPFCFIILFKFLPF